MSDSIAIKVDNVSKTFRLPHEKNMSVKSLVINLGKGRTYEKQSVLNDISFEVKKGEFFGIVGRNGSGKSTLLKMLAGIYQPSKGNIQINGKLTPFIELGVGFSPELTGRENVFLNGALLGFSRKEMDALYDDIVEFAELERFMDQKLKNYSSGMQVRLAFSIAIRAKSDILVLDEVLAVGDEAFQRKCTDYFNSLKRSKQTVVLVTHDMGTVRKFCDKAILIDNGDIKSTGLPNDVANEYSKRNINDPSDGSSNKNTPVPDDEIKVSVNMVSEKILTHKDTAIFDVKFKSPKPIHAQACLSISPVSVTSVSILDDSSEIKVAKSGVYRYKFPLRNLNDGDFRVTAQIRNDNNEVLAYTTEANSTLFIVRNNIAGRNNALFLKIGKGTWQ